MNPTPGLRLYTSNRTEVLADAAADIVAAPLSSPFVPETVVVPNRGMERWLSLRLADRLGIWANAEFLFPNAFVNKLFTGVFPRLPDTSPFDPALLTWRIMALLSNGILRDPRFADLASYLADGRPLKRFQLCTRIAETFDRYTVYRPDMVNKWEREENDGWQPLLWRKIVADHTEPHRARLWEMFFTHNAGAKTPALPERVIVFGLTSLPPSYCALLNALGGIIPVHLFVGNPCAEYWDDIVSEREAARVERKELKKKSKGEAAADLHLEQGNALLAALGAHGRDFFAALHDGNGEEIAKPVDPGSATLLTALQSAILNLRDSIARPVPTLDAADGSVQVHACHSPLREVEVLYDHLLDCFNNRPDLNPSDVLVMMPDITAYAPFIRAVFDTPESPRRKIPYTIADLALGSESAAAKTLLALLALPLSRFEASAVMALLETPAVRTAFDIDETELPLLRRWVAASGARWALAAAPPHDRDGLPVSSENTWEAGCARLLLGYALPSGSGALFGGIAGYDAIEGLQAQLAGKLAKFIDGLSAFTVQCRGAHTLSGWSDLLLRLLDAFFAPNESEEDEVEEVRSLVYSLRDPEKQGAPAVALDLETIIDYCTMRLDRSFQAHAPFPGGGVTFCAMLPMRSIPFRVLCCIGMNDTAFPRTSYHASWDLIAAQPRRGDRRTDEEDRYIFLEAILSAREQLYISYTGQDLRDNSARRPSVIVEELLAFLEKDNDARQLRDRIVTVHRLQPWSPVYFCGAARHFSYSAANAAAAKNVSAGPAMADSIFCPEPLPPPPADLMRINVETFISFFKNPLRSFCNRRLGCTLEEQERQLADAENFAVTGLDNYRIAQELAARALRGDDAESSFTRLKAMGLLPHGNVGKCYFDRLHGEISVFADDVRLFAGSQTPLPPLTVEIKTGPLELSGRIGDIYPARRIACRFAPITPNDLFDLWVSHLLLNMAAPSSYPKESSFCGKDGRVSLQPVKTAAEELRKIALAYELGLRSPLPFFPKSSYDCARRMVVDGKPQSEALRHAQEVWQGNRFVRGEKDDPYYVFLCGQGFSFDDTFVRMALDIWAPYFMHRLNADEGGNV